MTNTRHGKRCVTHMLTTSVGAIALAPSIMPNTYGSRGQKGSS